MIQNNKLHQVPQTRQNRKNVFYFSIHHHLPGVLNSLIVLESLQINLHWAISRTATRVDQSSLTKLFRRMFIWLVSKLGDHTMRLALSEAKRFLDEVTVGKKHRQMPQSAEASRCVEHLSLNKGAERRRVCLKLTSASAFLPFS